MLLGFQFTTLIPGYFDSKSTVLVVDLKVSNGTRLEIYVNGNYSEPLLGKLVPGQRQQYRLTGLAETIRTMRIDPGEAPNAVIDFYGIWAEDKDGAFGRIPASTIAGWQSANLTSSGVVDGAAHFVASSNDPMLLAQPNLTLRSTSPTLISKFINMLSNPRGATLMVVGFGFCALLLVAAFSPARSAHPIIAIICGLLTTISIYGFGTIYHSMAPIDAVVGRAGFHGLSTAPLSLGILSATVLSILVAIGFGYYRKGQIKAVEASPSEIHGYPESKYGMVKKIAVITVILAIFLFFFPAFNGHLQHWLTYQAAPDWDGNNVLIWNYLSHIGGLPFLDFWYPYSGQYIFYLPAPTGLFMHGVFQTAVFSITFYSIYRVTGRNVYLAAIGVAALIIGGTIAVYWGNVRYLQALSIGLTYLAIDRTEERIQPAHYWFWAACCLSLYFEPAQAVYAAPAILVKIVLDIALDGPLNWGAVLRRMIRDFSVPALFLIGRLVLFAINGQMSNFADFYLGLDDQSASGAVPANLVHDITNPLSVQFLILVAPMVMVGIGLYDRLRAGRDGSHAGDAMMVLGLVGVMILQKHLIRPMDWQALVIPALGCFVYAAAKRKRTIVETATAGGVLGAYIAIVTMSGALPGHWYQLKDGPERLLGFFMDDSMPFDEANAKQFAPFHFTRFKDEVKVSERIQVLSLPGETARMYVLTDNQVIYILLGQKPPYHSNMYNSSPIYEQKKVLQWLVENTPTYVVFDPGKLIFDTFQAIVRTPLYVNHVIENYTPLETVGTLEILRRRRAGEPVATKFWREKIGATLAFGHFPRASTASKLPDCALETECQDFLKITVPKGTFNGKTLAIPFKAGGLDFEATFVVVKEVETYYLSLTRMWFWDVLNRSEITTRIENKRLPKGIDVKFQRRAAGSDILY